MDGTLDKPVIAAINGFAMGGGFQLVERTDLRVAVHGAVFEISEAKRWLLGGYNHGFLAGLPHPIATEMALGFRFTAERLLPGRLPQPCRGAGGLDADGARDGGAHAHAAARRAREHGPHDAADAPARRAAARALAPPPARARRQGAT